MQAMSLQSAWWFVRLRRQDFGCLLAVLFTVLTSTAWSDDVPLAITNINVIDVTADSKYDARLANQTVVIRENKIAQIGAANEIEVPESIAVVNGDGMYLVPGYYDMHVHLAWPDDEATNVVLPLLFAHGITGVRDMGSDNSPPRKTLGELRQLQSAIQRGELLGPRIVGLCRKIPGRGIGVDRASIDPRTEDEGREAARNAALRGVDFLKIYSHLPRAAFFGLMDEAQRIGLPVAGHLPHSVTPIEASNAGIKSIEHARFPAYACGPGYDAWRNAVVTYDAKKTTTRPSSLFRAHQRTLVPNFDEAKCIEILDVFAKNGTWLCPTHTTRKMDAFASDPEYRSDWRRDFISPDRLSSWDRDLDSTARVSQDTKEHYKAFFRLSLRVTGLAHKRGVPILVGTDCYDTHVFPGFSYHDELQHLQEAGLSPLEILKAATIQAAKFLDIDDEFGDISVGKYADLVLLKKDPLSDIRSASEIHAVVFNGKIHESDELQQIVENVKSHVAKLRNAQAPLIQLWTAVLNNDIAKVRDALKQGIDVNEIDMRFAVAGGNGRRALNYAAIRDNSKMIRELLSAGADIDLANKSGFTPLMHAAEYGAIHAASALIEAGADVTKKSLRGHTALQVAELRKDDQMIALLSHAMVGSTKSKQH